MWIRDVQNYIITILLTTNIFKILNVVQSDDGIKPYLNVLKQKNRLHILSKYLKKLKIIRVNKVYLLFNRNFEVGKGTEKYFDHGFDINSLK